MLLPDEIKREGKSFFNEAEDSERRILLWQEKTSKTNP